MVWNLFSFKGDFSFGKSQKLQGATSGLQGGWVTWVIWCFTKKLCLRRDAWVGALSWWSCQSPVAHSCGLLNHLNSFCGGMVKVYEKSDADSLLYSLSHFECNSHTVDKLTQQCLLPPLTSTVKSSLFTHVHSSPLSLAARLHDVMKIILIILTMAELFSGHTTHTHTHTHPYYISPKSQTTNTLGIYSYI